MNLMFFMSQAFFVTIIGGLVLYLFLFPAFRMVSVGRRTTGVAYGVCMLLALTWTTGSALSGVVLQSALTPNFSGPPQINHALLWMAPVVFTIFAAVCGLVARLGGQFPYIVRLTAIAGLTIGILNLLPTLLQLPWMGAGMMLIYPWFGLPIVALYISAGIQQSRLTQYRRGMCRACKCKGGAAQRSCPECGIEARHLCHKCHRLVDAKPGDRCPRCKSQIASRCWRCSYSWQGLTSIRCPECGIWKPVNQAHADPPTADPA